MLELILFVIVACVVYRLLLVRNVKPQTDEMKPLYLFDRVTGSVRYLGIMRPCDIIMRSYDRFDLFDYNDLIQFMKIYGLQT